MRVLLISANRGEGLPPVFPLGLAYLAGNVGPGHELRALDLFLTPEYAPALSEIISSFHPQLIGVSVRNLDAQDYYAPASLLDDARQVIAQCRRLTDAPVVIGGTAMTILPGEMLAYLGADAGVVGEGESTFARLVDRLEEGASLEGIEGVLTPGGLPMVGGREDVASLRLPAWEALSLPEYLSRGTAANVRTKRGCPMRCIYCSTRQLEGSSLRLRDPEVVVDELEILARDFGVRMAHFVDANFNCPPDHAAAICESIIRRGLCLRWQCGLHLRYVSKELIELVKRAGCVFVSVGAESGSQHMLANLGRNYGPDDVERTCRWLKQTGIEHWTSLLIGGPEETPDTVEESLAQMEAVGETSVHIRVGIRIYPNTPLCEIARREGVIGEGTNLLFPAFYLSPSVEPMVVERMTRALAAHPNWNCNAVPSQTSSWGMPQGRR